MKGKMDQLQQQQQRLLLSPKMKQSLHLLKLPITELSAMIRSELEQNPLLEVENQEENGEDSLLLLRKTNQVSSYFTDESANYIENCYAEEESLFTHLLSQAKERFAHPQELHMAEELIGSINERGFFEGNISEIALLHNWPEKKLLSILEIIQTFDPPGIGSRNMQELLLRQLEQKGQRESLSYRIIHDHYDSMLHNRIQAISKALQCEVNVIYQMIKEEIASLELSPGRKWQQGHYKTVIGTITPDVTIEVTESAILVDVNEERIPHLQINEKYLQMLYQEATEETKRYLHEKLLSGKSLLKNLYERNQTLYRIAEEIATYQSAYFLNPKATLLPMTMKELGKRLDLHESTIARAASGKYINTPRGVLAMRTFFSHGYEKEGGDWISSTSIKDLVREIIENENHTQPYSDETIAEMIQRKGVTCARRTIAKYRKELGLGNRGQRRKYT